MDAASLLLGLLLGALLATAATVIASQAVITGAFSVARQAMLLGSGVIIASGLYTAHRERLRARERRGEAG